MRMLKTIIAGGLVACILAAGTSSSAAPAPEAGTMLDAYERALASTRRWSMEVVISGSVERPTLKPGSPARTGRSFNRAVYRRDGDRIDVELIKLGEADADGKPRPDEYAGERNRAILDGSYISYERRPGETVGKRGMYAANGAKFVINALGRLDFASALEGYIIDPEPVVEICRRATTRSVRGQPELVDGHPCWVLDTSSKLGRCSVWFDPEVGFWAKKIVLDKGADDMCGGERVGSWSFIPDSGQGTVTAKRFTYTVDGMKFERFGEILLPTACRVTVRREFSDGSWNVARTDCTREKIDLKPDFKALEAAGAFAPELAEGAVLANQENLQLPYVWRGGKPVPRDNVGGAENWDSTLRQRQLRPDGSAPTTNTVPKR